MDEQFIYLDGADEREQVIERLREVRQAVLNIADQLPESHHYSPRYNGQSLAVMLARLHMFDRTMLWMIRAASNGYPLRIPRGAVGFVDAVARWTFQKRLVEVTMRGVRKQEQEIIEFVRTVPLDALSKDVPHPGKKDVYTVERAIQVFFIHHWEQQLMLMQQVDGVAGRM
ncbi:MAG: hypothetical protein AAFV33_11585 [Chloroflexota bacterium]